MRARAHSFVADLAGRAIGRVCTLRGRTGDLGVRAIWQASIRRGYTNARLVDALIASGDVAVDVGACVGYFSRRMLQLVGAQGAVLAIEPNPAFQDALENIRRQHANFRFAIAAASAVPGTATLYIPRLRGRQHPGLASLQPPDPNVQSDRIEVPRVRLDDLLAGQSGRISLVKIDVEGHESAVLEGAAATLARRPPLLIEIEQRHHADPIDDVIASILERGYDGWALFRGGMIPLSDFDVQRDQLRYVSDELQDAMPPGYINDFCFVPVGWDPPPDLRSRRPASLRR